MYILYILMVVCLSYSCCRSWTYRGAKRLGRMCRSIQSWTACAHPLDTRYVGSGKHFFQNGSGSTDQLPICEPWCWYIYLQNWLMLVGQMLGFIFQHHGSHMWYDDHMIIVIDYHMSNPQNERKTKVIGSGLGTCKFVWKASQPIGDHPLWPCPLRVVNNFVRHSYGGFHKWENPKKDGL